MSLLAISWPAAAQGLSALRSAAQLTNEFETKIRQPLPAGNEILDIIPDQSDGFYMALIVTGEKAIEVGLFASDRNLGLAHVDASGAIQWFDSVMPVPRSDTRAYLAMGDSGDVYMGAERRMPFRTPAPNQEWCYKREYWIARFSGQTGRRKWRRKSIPSSGGSQGFSQFAVIGEDPVFLTSQEGSNPARMGAWLLDGETSMGNSIIVKRDPNNALAFVDGDFRSITQEQLTVVALNGANGDVKWARNLLTKQQWVDRSSVNAANRQDPVNALNDQNFANITRTDLIFSFTHTHLLMETAAMVHDGELYPYAQADKFVLVYSMDANGTPLSYRRFYTDQKPQIAAVPGSGDIIVRTVGGGGRVSLERFGLTGPRKWKTVFPAGTRCDVFKVQGTQVLCLPQKLRTNKPDIVRVDLKNGDTLDPLTVDIFSRNTVWSHTIEFNDTLTGFAASHWEETSRTTQPRCDVMIDGISTSFLMKRKPQLVTADLSDRVADGVVVQNNDISFAPDVAGGLSFSDQQMCPVYVDIAPGTARNTKAFVITKSKDGSVTRGAALKGEAVAGKNRLVFSAPDGSEIEVERGRAFVDRGKSKAADITRRHAVSCRVPL